MLEKEATPPRKLNENKMMRPKTFDPDARQYQYPVPVLMHSNKGDATKRWHFEIKFKKD